MIQTIAPGFEGNRSPLTVVDGVLELVCPTKGLIAGERCLFLQEELRCKCEKATDPRELAEHRVRIASTPAPARDSFGFYLTFAERQRILGQLAEGYSAVEVAEHFGISSRHVERLRQLTHRRPRLDKNGHPVCARCGKHRVRHPDLTDLCGRCRSHDDRSLSAP